jgi:Avidin family
MCIFIWILCGVALGQSMYGECFPTDEPWLTTKLPNGTLVFHGHWQNELGSIMILVPAFIDRNYIGWGGSYQSSVGDAAGRYGIKGRSILNNGVQIISWDVVWSNANKKVPSITSWNGYLDPNEKGKNAPKIYANWIMTDVSGAFWNSTLTGQDIFFQVPLT